MSVTKLSLLIQYVMFYNICFFFCTSQIQVINSSPYDPGDDIESRVDSTYVLWWRGILFLNYYYYFGSSLWKCCFSSFPAYQNCILQKNKSDNTRNMIQYFYENKWSLCPVLNKPQALSTHNSRQGSLHSIIIDRFDVLSEWKVWANWSFTCLPPGPGL